MDSLKNFFKSTFNNLQDYFDEDENKSKKEIKLLIIGKTGAGKSTLINMLINQALNIKYNEERAIAISQQVTIKNKGDQNMKSLQLECNLEKFKDKQSDLQKDQSKSQTQSCNVYSVETKDYVLKLIDTPGLGDTKGTDQDELNVKKIISEVSKLDKINGIIYVHKATDTRYDAYVKYYIQETKAMLTKECQKNFVVCFTNVINQQRLDAYPVLEKQGIINQDNYFQFENDCLVPPHFYSQRDDNQIKLSAVYWDENKNNYEKLINKVAHLPPQSTQPIIQLHIDKEVMKHLIFEKYHQIKHLTDNEIFLKQSINELKQKQQLIDKTKPEINKEITVYEPHTVDQIEDRVEKVSIHPDKLTTCLLCHKLCHDPCFLNEIFDKGHINLKNCFAFAQSDYCVECQHHFNEHTHSQFKFETKKVRFQRQILKPVKKIVTDKNLQEIIQQQEMNKIQIEQEIAKTQIEITKQNKTIESEMRIISFLYKKIKNISQDPIHDALLDYLQQQIQNIKKDVSLTPQQANEQIKNIQQKYDQYKTIRDQFEKNGQNITLTAEELEQLNKQIEEQQQQLAYYFTDVQDKFHKYREQTTISKKDLVKNQQQFNDFKQSYLLDTGKLNEDEKILDNIFEIKDSFQKNQKRFTYRGSIFQSDNQKYSSMITYQFNQFYFYWLGLGQAKNSFKIHYQTKNFNLNKNLKLNVFGNLSYLNKFQNAKFGFNIFNKQFQAQTKINFYNLNNFYLTQKLFTFKNNFFIDTSFNMECKTLQFNKFNYKIGSQNQLGKLFINHKIKQSKNKISSDNLVKSCFDHSQFSLNGEYNLTSTLNLKGKINLNNKQTELQEQETTTTTTQSSNFFNFENKNIDWVLGASYKFNNNFEFQAKINSNQNLYFGSKIQFNKFSGSWNYQLFNKTYGFNLFKNPLNIKIDFNI